MRLPAPPRETLKVRLQHVSIVIPRDGATRARAFYGGLLALEEREVLPMLDPSAFIWYRLGTDLELHLMLGDEAQPKRPHFCVFVDHLEGLQGRLEAAGIETREGTPIIGRRRFTCRDPFGNLIEFAQVDGTRLTDDAGADPGAGVGPERAG